MQSYFVHDLLDIVHSGDAGDGEAYLDQVIACGTLKHWPHRSGPVYEKCVTAARTIEQNTQRGKRLHYAATKVLNALLDNPDRLE